MAADVLSANDQQLARLRAGGAGSWELLRLFPRDPFVQPSLTRRLRRIGEEGRRAFYEGKIAASIARAVEAAGGAPS